MLVAEAEGVVKATWTTIEDVHISDGFILTFVVELRVVAVPLVRCLQLCLAS